MNLDRDADVFVLSLGDGENRFNDDFLSRVQLRAGRGRGGPGTTRARRDGRREDLVQRARPRMDGPEHGSNRGLPRRRPRHVREGARARRAQRSRDPGSLLRGRRDARSRARLQGHARGPRLLVPARGRHQHPLHARDGGAGPSAKPQALGPRGDDDWPPVRRAGGCRSRTRRRSRSARRCRRAGGRAGRAAGEARPGDPEDDQAADVRRARSRSCATATRTASRSRTAEP